MDGWLDEDGWIDGWMDGWMHGWIDRWMDGCMDGWMDEWILQRIVCTTSQQNEAAKGAAHLHVSRPGGLRISDWVVIQ